MHCSDESVVQGTLGWELLIQGDRPRVSLSQSRLMSERIDAMTMDTLVGMRSAYCGGEGD